MAQASQVPAPGQRWLSAAEPELGLGTVLRCQGRRIEIVYTGSGVLRQYALDSAPLLRAEFGPGDWIHVEGRQHAVQTVTMREGLRIYRCAEGEFSEGLLDAEQALSRADSRLLSGRIGSNRQFEFRAELLRRRARARTHPGWGLLGARIDLIDHQLRVIASAARRRPPRLLLADEVGLGKTIEACAILAQQLASGRAGRVLVLVPESLVNQWFVELRRRFNLAFAIYDEERCQALERDDQTGNPFEDSQWVIASSDWLASRSRRGDQARAAGWDLLLVDEAHHLEWTPEQASPGYRLVEALAADTPGLLLLTATPEQLGLAGHFARLRLLDPARHVDLARFEAETRSYHRMSAVVRQLEAGAPLSLADTELLARLFEGEAETLPALLGAIAQGDDDARERLIAALIDRHGTGRVMVRNRRETVGGFPRRVKYIETLPATADATVDGALRAEFLHDSQTGASEPQHDYSRDPRMDWLLRKLDAIAPAKALLLCHSRAKVQALEDALRLRAGLAVARFHEDMNLLQRDRNAAWFAEPDGARLLIASEIGAEGRNFQFAQHLILWDLPLDPDRLEQRIGRLDRIGQRGDVHIHACALTGSAQHTLLRWYDEGLDAFCQVLADGRALLREFGAELVALATGEVASSQASSLSALIERTRASHAELARRIHDGRDRLLELASQHAPHEDLLGALRADDEAAADDDFPLRLLEQLGVQNEELGPHLWRLDPEYLNVEGLDGLGDGPRAATFDRRLALARDDLLYLRDDHPMLLSAGEALLSGEFGNATVLIDQLPPRTVILEAIYLLECVADRGLDVERYLPPTPLRVAIDTRLREQADYRPDARALKLSDQQSIDPTPLRKLLSRVLAPMLAAAGNIAQTRAGEHIARARTEAEALLGAELERLQALSRINPAVRSEEIAALSAERDALTAALPRARPRLDALRLIASPDIFAGRG